MSWQFYNFFFIKVCNKLDFRPVFHVVEHLVTCCKPRLFPAESQVFWDCWQQSLFCSFLFFWAPTLAFILLYFTFRLPHPITIFLICFFSPFFLNRFCVFQGGDAFFLFFFENILFRFPEKKKINAVRSETSLHVPWALSCWLSLVWKITAYIASLLLWLSRCCSFAVKDREAPHKWSLRIPSLTNHNFYMSAKNAAKSTYRLAQNSFISGKNQDFIDWNYF